jgi:hypothetical protein
MYCPYHVIHILLIIRPLLGLEVLCLWLLGLE